MPDDAEKEEFEAEIRADTYPDHVHDWFGLSYASYLVLPRVVLSSMPPAWQRLFVEMLRLLDEEFPDVTLGPYDVRKRDEGSRYVHDPLSEYRHRRLTPKSAQEPASE